MLKGESEQPPLPAHRYNKDVSGFPYCVRQQNKEVSRHNKETDEQDKESFQQKRPKKSKKLTKTPAFSRFRSIFPARENKNAAKILAESKKESLS